MWVAATQDVQLLLTSRDVMLEHTAYSQCVCWHMTSDVLAGF